MWTYSQRTSLLKREGVEIATGYSGYALGKNNPALQQVHDIGPIPRGSWLIGAPEHVQDVGPHGPFVLRLSPKDGTETYGRAGFLIHGDSVAHMGTASHGCIILPRHTREEIAATHDTELEVMI